MASGFCIGIVGDAGVRAAGQQPRMYVGMMMMLIFAEVLGEFTFIWGVVLVISFWSRLGGFVVVVVA